MKTEENNYEFDPEEYLNEVGSDPYHPFIPYIPGYEAETPLFIKIIGIALFLFLAIVGFF